MCGMCGVCVRVLGRGRHTGGGGVGQPARGRSGPWVGSSPFSFPADSSAWLLRGAGVETGASVVVGDARPSTEAPDAPRLTPTAGAKVAKASRRHHMARSKARTRAGPAMAGGFASSCWGSGAPRPFLPPPHAPCGLRHAHSLLVGLGPRSRGVGRGGEEDRGGERKEGAGRGQGCSPGSPHPPTLPLPLCPAPQPPAPNSPASLGKDPAPWIPRDPVRPSHSGHLLCTMPRAKRFTRGLSDKSHLTNW